MEKETEFQKNVKFFRDNLDRWLTDDLYRNKHAVVADQKLKGIFDTVPNAWDFASSRLILGEFVIQEIINEDKQISYIASGS